MPNQTIRNSVQKRRQQVDAEYKARGRTVADTELKKELDERNEVLDDIELLEGSERPSEQARINEYKAAMERSRRMLTTRVSKRRTDWNDPPTEAESHRSSSRRTVVSQPSRLSSTSTPAQAQYTPPRKRRRTEDPYAEQLERLVDVIDEIQTGFGDRRLRDDRADKRWDQDIEERLGRIHRDIERIRADMPKLKDLLQKTFADRLVQK